MTKNFCDCCNQELKNTELFGGIMRLGKNYTLAMSAQPQPIIQKEAWDLCENCSKKVWELAEQLKSDANKK